MDSSRTSLASRTSSRTHFEVLGLEASSPRKLACPRLEDSTIFEPLKFRWKMPETLRKVCKDLFLVSSSKDRLKKILKTFSPEKKFLRPFFWDCLKKNLENLLFFGEHLRLCSWFLASRGSVLGLDLEIILCPWPWPWSRALCPRLHLWLGDAATLVGFRFESHLKSH